MTINLSDLADFGWNAFFTSQLHSDELAATIPVRVMAVHRNRLSVSGPGIDAKVSPFSMAETGEEAIATVGDWLLLDRDTQTPLRLLARKSLFKRRSAGTTHKLQLIAANIDTLFIVTSCNQDFNIARLERYLVLAREAEVTPVVIITKADLVDAPEDYVRAAAKLVPGLLVEMLDARDAHSVAALAPWCTHGQTIALIGSSGVGKSTLVNTLCGTTQAHTQDIREDDAKGRHTTSGRALYALPGGGWIVDTPGMRELQLTDVKSGIEDFFTDIMDLQSQCRFNDCQHQVEPGCAVLKAIEDGTLDEERLQRWRKLAAEDAYNSSSASERRTRDRVFGKMIRDTLKDKRR